MEERRGMIAYDIAAQIPLSYKSNDHGELAHQMLNSIKQPSLQQAQPC